MSELEELLIFCEEVKTGILHSSQKSTLDALVDRVRAEHVALEAKLSKMEEALKDVVARMRAKVEKPMNTWSAGDVIAADTVEFWADELQEALAGEDDLDKLPTQQKPTEEAMDDLIA